jgi:hypothetical protein
MYRQALEFSYFECGMSEQELLLPGRERFTDLPTGALPLHPDFIELGVADAKELSADGMEQICEYQRRRSFTPVCRDGLEKRIERSAEFANFTVKCARHAG